MMQHSHLTAWQVHAPWDKRSKIEQDLRLARGIAAIFSDDVLATHVAMRGGTVLHKRCARPKGSSNRHVDDLVPEDKQIIRAMLIRNAHEDVYERFGWPLRPVADGETERGWIAIVVF
jgi:hypothetical protein